MPLLSRAGADGLGRKLFKQKHQYLQRHGFKLGTGTIVDATLISALSSTKNKDQQRAPDMHQTKKGNQWYFGMKAHVGIDSRTKLIHSVVTTAANVLFVICALANVYLVRRQLLRLWKQSVVLMYYAKRGPQAAGMSKYRPCGYDLALDNLLVSAIFSLLVTCSEHP